MKHLLILIIFATVSFAFDKTDSIKIQILEKIITEISIEREVYIWSDNQDILTHLNEHNKLNTSESCKDATIIILENKNTLPAGCASKHIFVLNYQLLSDIPQSFGALFWKKGRPNIVILKSRINAQSIKISNDLKPYLEEKIW